MKKMIAMLLACMMIFACTACAAKTEPAAPAEETAAEPAPAAEAPAAEEEATEEAPAAEEAAADSDLAYIQANGKLVVGITDFAPMDYQDENGEWIGFDADMAKAFAKSLGVEVEFVEIVWDNKLADLNGKNIDCVWNGMTLTEDVKAKMETSKPYCTNAQVIVVPADKAEQYATAEACKELSFAVENGSAGKDMAVENGFKYTEVTAQSDAVAEVASGTSDAAIIDLLMAGAMVGEGTGFAKLTYTAKLNSEDYGVGFRKGSDLAAALNDFFAASLADGSMEKVATQYGVQESLIK